MDEIILIQRCKEGNLDAFNALFKKYNNQAIRTVYLISGRSDIAEDVVQEAFVTCFRELKSLKKPETFQSWFYRLLTRITWRYCSKEKKHLYTECIDENNTNLIADKLLLSDIAEREEIKELLYDAINKLSTPLKTTIILYYYNELSIHEIAKILGCFEGTVKSRLHNGRKLLEKELKGAKFDGYYFVNSFKGKERNNNVKSTTF